MNQPFISNVNWINGYLLPNGNIESINPADNSYSSFINCDGYDSLTILAAVWNTVQPCCVFYDNNDNL